MQNKSFDELSKITKVILEDTVNYADLSLALKNIKTLFFTVSELDTSSTSYKTDIYHDTGKAIGTGWAAMCIDDLLRTKRFIKGTKKAIEASLRTKKDTHDTVEQSEAKPVTLLYVGTGPFATLVMPLTTIFKPEELQLVLVEVNPMSVESVRSCIRNLGVEAYVKDIYCSDAAKLQLSHPQDIDILLLECLQIALVKEQQVAITYNLLPQLKKEATLVPEEIKLSVCLVDSKKKMDYMTRLDVEEGETYFKKIHPVFVLNKEEILHHTSVSNPEKLKFPPVVTLLTEEDKKDYDMISIATEICVFGDERLDVDDCSLTMLQKIAPMEKALPFKGITTQYLVNEKPGLEVHFVDG